MENTYLRDPIKVVVVDPFTHHSLRTYVVLGAAPEKVVQAALGRGPRRAETLRAYYGADYAKKLGIGAPPATAFIFRPQIVGGAERQFVDDAALASISAALAAEKPAVEAEPVEPQGRITYTRDVRFYPHDNWVDVKAKVQLLTGIPTYRQHLFYASDNQTLTTYNVIVDGLYTVDMFTLGDWNVNIANIPIDMFMYDARGSIFVESLEEFELLGEALSVPVLYVADLNQMLGGTRMQMQAILNDTYQFELFYYGFIIKYFPQLTPECFHDYIVSEAGLAQKFPDLVQSTPTIAAWTGAEAAIIDALYENAARSAAVPLSISITGMTAHVGSRALLNARNIFDKTPTTAQVPIIQAYISIESKYYSCTKRHITAPDIQIPASVQKEGLIYVINMSVGSDESRYLFLNVLPSGDYFVKSSWNEEEELDFDQILAAMKRHVDPVIKHINSLHKYAFMSGEKLQLITKGGVDYGDLTVCAFYKRVLNGATFRRIRGLWEDYMRARITSSRALQQFDRYEFLFRKGMFQYDMDNVERIINVTGGTPIKNYYAHLSNATVRQKWTQNYSGRLVRMTHRTSDIRFEVNDLHETEFEIFMAYLRDFMYKALLDPGVLMSMKAVQDYSKTRKLRKLHEQDPELYNLKAYGAKKVYSAHCQKPKQPLIYTDDEMAKMSPAELKKLTRYWNFTLNKPAYYGCPSKKYPYLSFHVGKHPRGYCLPCCSIKPQDIDSKKARITQECLKNHVYHAPADVPSHHVINYAKEIDPGRVSRLPDGSLREMLTGIVRADDKPVDYYFYGVHQALPGVPRAGVIFSLAAALGMDVPELGRRILELLKSPAVYLTLLNGRLPAHFSHDELLDTFRDLFVRTQSLGITFGEWEDLFLEAVEMLGYGVFLLVDDRAKHAAPHISLQISQNLRDILGEKTDGQFVVINRRQTGFAYPMFLLNLQDYLRGEVEALTFAWDSPVVAAFRRCLNFFAESDAVNLELDLPLLQKFADERGYKIVARYSNLQHLAYGYGLRGAAGPVYVPTKYSMFTADDIETTINKPLLASAGATLQLMTELAEFVKNNYARDDGTYAYAAPSPAEVLHVGPTFYAWRTATGAVWYFAPTPSTHDIMTIGKVMPMVDTKYNYLDVNTAILQRTPGVSPAGGLLGPALYKNYLYQLFVMEFVNHLDLERNAPIREALVDGIRKTNFKQAADEFRAVLHELLRDFPADIATLQNQLVSFARADYDKKMLLHTIDETVYEFDHATINTLRAMSRDECRAELLRLAKKFTVVRSLPAMDFPNIYIPCNVEDSHGGYCGGKKLIVETRAKLESLCSILAADIGDDLKYRYMLNNIWVNSVIDAFDFERYPAETISVELMSYKKI